MSEGKGRRRHWVSQSNKINIGDKGKEITESIDENSLVVQQFRAYAAELDDKHDRAERILKIGRDITIESKRIIFLLHTIDSKSKEESVLNESKRRLNNVGQNLFINIAKELEKQDAYQYLRAYRGSLEEYIEAVTFHQYLQRGVMEDWKEIEKMLSYTISENSEVRPINALVTPYEYILGLTDLTGELMRKCINNLATGDVATCFQTCNFVRNMYKGFLGCKYLGNREINRKLCILKQSLHKMENVCYTIRVRGSEIPKHILVDVATEESSDGDEGYQVY